jgi:hypothetical protein
MAGILDDRPFQRSEYMQMIGAAEWLRENGVKDEVIPEALSDRPVSQSEHDAVAGQHKRDMV